MMIKTPSHFLGSSPVGYTERPPSHSVETRYWKLCCVRRKWPKNAATELTAKRDNRGFGMRSSTWERIFIGRFLQLKFGRNIRNLCQGRSNFRVKKTLEIRRFDSTRIKHLLAQTVLIFRCKELFKFRCSQILSHLPWVLANQMRRTSKQRTTNFTLLVTKFSHEKNFLTKRIFSRPLRSVLFRVWRYKYPA